MSIIHITVSLEECCYTTEPRKRKEFTVNVHEIHQMRILLSLRCEIKFTFDLRL